MKTTFNKQGISLIAVLMFMLAATTASVILFQWINQENFSSGSRLKASEAYQASQSGLEAVQGWLANKGADAGALIRTFEVNQKPVLLVNSMGADLLGAANFKTNSSKKQEFQVYLTGANTSKKPYELKFLSVGKARDGSKHSQVGIFNVDGLYRIELEALRVFRRGTARKVPPYFGTAHGTQGLLESAYLTGDLGSSSNKMQGYSTKGDAIVTGSMYVNSGMTIGCPVKPPYDGTHQDHLINPRNDAYPGRDNWLANMNRLDFKGNPDPLYGNLYVRENYLSDALGVCGNTYVGGNLTVNGTVVIWGDLYVRGNLIMQQNLTVLGNLTVDGDIDMGTASYELRVGYDKDNILRNTSANLVMTNTASSIKIGSNGAKVRIGGTYWSKGSCNNNCGVINKQNSYPADPMPQPGADTLAYLGNQITKTKVGNPPKYTIPDPIVLGAKAEWETTPIPAECDAGLKAGGSWVNTSGYIDFSMVGDSQRENFMNALNNCAKIGNWTSPENDSKWLVLRVNWSHINNFNLYVLEGDFIIVVMNKPSQKMYLPLTTNKSNVLLYLKLGASNMESNDPKSQCNQALPNARMDACVRNYFIYSEADIDKIDGRFFLTGNIFMANGGNIPSMTDIVIESNEKLFDALSGSGAIKDNVDKCVGTALADANGKCKICGAGENPRTHTCIENPNPDGGSDLIEIAGINPQEPMSDPSWSYVPVIPHLKVKLQSQYAATEYSDIESGNKFVKTEPAVLLIPRIVYAKPGTIVSKAKLAEYISAIYLNGAYPEASDRPANRTAAQTLLVNKMASNCDNIISKNAELGIYSCTINLSDATKCNSNLCKNSFYVVIGTHVTSKSDGGYKNPGGGLGAIDLPSGGENSGGSGGGNPGGVTVELKCSVNNGGASSVKKYTNLNLANPANINAKCVYSNGDEFDVTQLGMAQYSMSGNTDVPGTYKVSAMSLCPYAGTQVYSVECTGQINVVDLICTNPNSPFMKVGSTIQKPETPKCLPSNTNATTVTWDGYPNISTSDTFTIPDGEDASTEYAITATARCGLEEDDIIADCGKVKVATVTCPNTGTAQAGGTIVLPNLTCTHNNSTVTAKTQSILVAGGTGTQTVTGTADCGTTTELKDIPFSCNISVKSSDCTYKSSEYCGASFANLTNVTQTNLYSAQGNAPACIFATNINAMANVYNGSTIKVNGVQISNVDNGRCGMAWIEANTGSKPFNQTQPSCSDALSGVPKQDGGYYIYVGGNGGYQHFYTTGGVPDCNESSTVGTSCDYNPSWCGDKDFSEVKDNSTTIPITGECLFISNFETIQPKLNSTVAINGLENAFGNDWGPYNTRPSKADGGFYVYVKKGEVNDWRGNGWKNIVAGTKKERCDAASSNLDGSCGYQASWCNSMRNISTSAPSGYSSLERCAFLTSITGVLNIGSARINGYDCSGYKANAANDCEGIKKGKVDGGYYLYIPAAQSVSSLIAVGGTDPNCTGGNNSSNACDYNTTWCPNIAWENIRWGFGYSQPAANQCACYFLGLDNGTSTPSCGPYGGAICTINSGDGGFYMHVCTGASGNPNTSNAGTPKSQPSCTNSSNTNTSPSDDISCFINETYYKNGSNINNAKPPSVTGCNGGTFTFKVDNSASTAVSGWANITASSNTGQFNNARNYEYPYDGNPGMVWLTKATCNGVVLIDADNNIGSRKRCGYISILDGAPPSAGECKNGSNQTIYCKWEASCYPIDSRFSSIGDGSVCSIPDCYCASLIRNCKDNSSDKILHTNSGCS